MVGSEAGTVFLCNKKAKSANERITHIYSGHHGPIYSIQVCLQDDTKVNIKRNPFYPKNFLSAGDWSVKLWSEDIRSPIMSTRYQTTYLTDACWSPTRPSVFFTAKMDGTVDAWDFTFKQNDPTLTLKISNAPIQSLRVQEQGRLAVAGDREGTVTMLGFSDTLSVMNRNEKQVFSQMLEREAKREKTLETVARDKRLKAAQQKRPDDATGAAKVDSSVSSVDQMLQQAEQEFLKADTGKGQGPKK